MRVLELEYKAKYKTEKIAEEYYEEDTLGCLRVNFGANEDNFICIDFFDGSESKLDENDKSVVMFSGEIALEDEDDILIDFLYNHIDNIEDFTVEVSNDHDAEDDTFPYLAYLKLTAREDGRIVNTFEWKDEE